MSLGGSMWVILIDRSPSMFQPFSGEQGEGTPGRVRHTEEATRWGAACEAVVREVGSLRGDEEIALFAFDATAKRVFEGPASQVDRLRAVLEGLDQGNGTDIAGALQAAETYLRHPGRGMAS